MRLYPNSHVEARFESVQEELFTSAICIEEIRYGAKIGPPGNRLWERAEMEVLPFVTVAVFDEAMARLAGDMRAEWKERGRPIGYRDGLLAATAKALDLILVTRNVRHFNHATGARVENWFESPPQAPSAQE